MGYILAVVTPEVPIHVILQTYTLSLFLTILCNLYLQPINLTTIDTSLVYKHIP